MTAFSSWTEPVLSPGAQELKNGERSECEQATVLVFLKYPQPGKVKTRLAESIGSTRAAELYRQWIGQILASLQPLRRRVRIIACFDGGSEEAFAPWHPLVDGWWPQCTGDLAERLESAFAQAHRLGGPVVAIGTDCLELDSSLLESAFNQLRKHDAVFGPATDGGYYLVGTSKRLPGFFRGIVLSRKDSLSQHLLRCSAQGWSFGFLPSRRDIDTWRDLQDYNVELRKSQRLRLAVVIPVLNEEASLPGTLRSLLAQKEHINHLVVADGGSEDGSVAVAKQCGAVVVVSNRRGRGCQVATALRQIEEDIVLIAHADMVFPNGSVERILEALRSDSTCPGGCLGHRFDRSGLPYRVMEWVDRRRAMRGISYGDQAQFFRWDTLANHGGFPDQPLMEDVELSKRLNFLGKPTYLDMPVTVAARRFKSLGFWRTLRMNSRLRGLYLRDSADCERLFREYYPSDEVSRPIRCDEALCLEE